MSDKKRIATYIKTAIEEIELAEQMSEPIVTADDFGKNLNGMRNFIAHEYANVDEDAIFTTLKEDLPRLKEVSKTLLDDLQNGSLDEFVEQ